MNSKVPKINVLLSIAGIVGGLLICVVAKDLNSKVYQFSGAQAQRLRDAVGQVDFSLLALGGALSVGSIVSLLLNLRAPRSAEGPDLSQVLRNCGIENTSGDPMQSLQTEVSRLKLEVMEARKRERAIVEKAVDVICVLNIDAKFLTVSRACQNAWGYDPKDLENTALAEILVGPDSGNILNSILGSANSIDKIIFECKLKRKDGRLLDVVWTAHWSATDGGLFCIVHDITERKYAEELLKSSESRLRRTLKNMPVGVLMVDVQDSIEFANAEAVRMLVRPTTEIMGTQLKQYIATPDKRVKAETQDSTSDLNLRRWMAEANRKDGSKFPVELSESIIEINGEQKAIVVFLDKTAEEELDRVKREFVAMVTHEIRTPISSVYGILALIEAGALGEMTAKGRELTRSVKVTCKRVIRLISDLLDLEKIQAGKFALDCKQVSLRYAMETSFDNVVSLADERKIVIDLPQTELCCWADEDRLVQVMVNLISNAIKYSPDSSTITLGIEDLQNGKIKISVSDKGRGIPEDKLAKVFDQFEQVELADAKKKGGTGLGLAICHAIVSEHGGEIGVNSKPGEGSSFWFTMPTSES